LFVPELVSVGIVTWNSADSLETCIDSLMRQSYGSIELIVVDNASHDNSLAIAAKLVPTANVIRNQTNQGFCQGHNLAIAQAKGEFYLPLNPDTRLETTFVESLVAAARRDPNVGIVTGKIYLAEIDRESGLPIIDETGLFLNRARRQYLRGFGEVDKGQYDRPGYVFGASGALPLYRRAMLEDVKQDGDYFDPTFFAHKEDVDLCWRSQLYGWKTYYEPSAIAYHHRSFRPSQRRNMASEIRLHAVKNRYLLLIKNDHLTNILLHAPWILSYDLAIILFIIFFERTSIRGLLMAAILAPQAFRKRRAIMKNKRVTAAYVRSYIR